MYKINIYPDENQKEEIYKNFICYRMVYNHFLKRRIDTWHKTGKNLGLYGCCSELTSLKHSELYSILQDVDSIALQQALVELDDDFQAFFNKKELYPQFKDKSEENYYITLRHNNNIYFNKGYIKLPKISPIKMEENADVPDSFSIKSVKITREKGNNYFATFYLYDDKEE